MRAQSPGNDRPATAAAIVRAAVVVSGMALGAFVGASGSTAEEPPTTSPMSRR